MSWIFRTTDIDFSINVWTTKKSLRSNEKVAIDGTSSYFQVKLYQNIIHLWTLMPESLKGGGHSSLKY